MFMTWVFWLAGAAAITDSLGGGLNCGYVPLFILLPKNEAEFIASRDHITYCGQLNAEEAFAWIEVCVRSVPLHNETALDVLVVQRVDNVRDADHLIARSLSFASRRWHPWTASQRIGVHGLLAEDTTFPAACILPRTCCIQFVLLSYDRL